MQECKGISITFSPRDEILEPVATIAIGPAARMLAERLLQHPDEQLREWTGVAGTGVLVVLGASDSLPWVDGVSYLGRDPRAPRLLVPTTLQPATVAIEVFEQAVLGGDSRLAPPLAVIVSPPRIFSLADALPIRRDRVRAWLEANP